MERPSASTPPDWFKIECLALFECAVETRVAFVESSPARSVGLADAEDDEDREHREIDRVLEREETHGIW